MGGSTMNQKTGHLLLTNEPQPHITCTPVFVPDPYLSAEP